VAITLFCGVNVFEESDLSFTFPTDWIVRKFDSTPAYQSLSGHGLKGVDFLCLGADDSLYLIEVKNYRKRGGGHKIVRRDPERLAEHVGRKFVDTKRLIDIFNRAMRRGWWPSLLLFWYLLHPRPRPNAHYWFWAEAERRVHLPENVYCVLWLETPESQFNYQAATEQALKAYLEPGNHLTVAEVSNPSGLAFTAVPV
jgi:hypothetical protein